MSEITFSISDTIEKAWSKFKQNWAFFIVVTLSWIFISIFIHSFIYSAFFPELLEIQHNFNAQIEAGEITSFSDVKIAFDEMKHKEQLWLNENSMIYTIKDFLLTCILFWFFLGFLKITLDSVKGLKPYFSQLFSIDVYKFLHVVAGLFIIKCLSLIMTQLSFILAGNGLEILIACVYIGYLYIMIRLSFFMFLVLDDSSLSMIQGFQKSWELTEKNIFKLVLFYIVLILILFISCFALLVGFFIALPVVFLSLAYLYHHFINVEN